MSQPAGPSLIPIYAARHGNPANVARALVKLSKRAMKTPRDKFNHYMNLESSGLLQDNIDSVYLMSVESGLNWFLSYTHFKLLELKVLRECGTCKER